MILRLGNKKQLPEGYVDLHNFSYVSSGSVLRWNCFTQEGTAFWSCNMYHKVFHIPFEINDIIAPDPNQVDLTFALRKGTGLEFEIIRKERVVLTDLSLDPEDNLKIWNCRVMIDRKNPFFSAPVRTIEENRFKLKGFLIRKDDVRT